MALNSKLSAKSNGEGISSKPLPRMMSMENEIDDNLDELGDAVGRLKALALASGQEVDRQNKVLEKLHGKTDNVDRKVRSATDRVSGP
jgi:archaellum component FlaC